MRHLGFATVLVLASCSCGDQDVKGKYYCAVNDQNLTLVAEGVKKRGSGGEVLETKGRLQIKGERAPKALRKLNLGETLTHSWFRKREFRLRFGSIISYPYIASAELTLKTRFNTNQGVFQGEYVFLTLAENRRDANLTGPITCKMD